MLEFSHQTPFYPYAKEMDLVFWCIINKQESEKWSGGGLVQKLVAFENAK